MTAFFLYWPKFGFTWEFMHFFRRRPIGLYNSLNERQGSQLLVYAYCNPYQLPEVTSYDLIGGILFFMFFTLRHWIWVPIDLKFYWQFKLTHDDVIWRHFRLWEDFLASKKPQCRNCLTLLTSSDLEWTLIPMVTILKMISTRFALERGQDLYCSSEKKIT